MTTNFTDTKDPTLQKLGDAIVNSIKLGNGSFPSAGPNAFFDRLGNAVPLAIPSGSLGDDDGGYTITIRVAPGGQSASAKVVPHTPRPVQALIGQIDIPTLATTLA